MKLQAKMTLNFILVVLLTVIVSFLLIDWSFQSQFSHFIEQKNEQWEELHHGQIISIITATPSSNNQQDVDTPPLQDPFGNPPAPGPETPEETFFHTVNNSLLWAALIDITFAVLVAYFLSTFLLRRIYLLKSSMNQYMADGTSKPVLHEGHDEVDDLAHIYNLLIEKIEKEEKIRKEFFIDMSHELRTPLTSVKGYLEGLVDTVFDQEKEKDIQKKALHETDRVIHLVKEMTVLAKLESENIKLTLKDVHLQALTNEVVEMLTPQITSSELTVEVHGDTNIQIDAYKFKQVFINLIENAIHYAKKKSAIVIKIGSIKDGSKEHSYWRISNKTEGIRKEDVEYFFERFYRGNKSRSYDAQRPHLGIGLNIVRKIVEEHKAKISARLEGEDIIFEILF